MGYLALGAVALLGFGTAYVAGKFSNDGKDLYKNHCNPQHGGMQHAEDVFVKCDSKEPKRSYFMSGFLAWFARGAQTAGSASVSQSAKK